jgi:aspartyl-tRNA(Asn)/glutamyl-tRNA(Gln) amidotransferase subunit C
MISKQEVEKLAGLSRLALTEEEKTRFQGEIEAILGFVGKIKEAAEEAPKPEYAQINSMRDDAAVHKTAEYKEALLDSAPEREGDFVKVKRILE